jgi:hypothetical protein
MKPMKLSRLFFWPILGIAVAATISVSFGQPPRKTPEPIGADHAEKMVKGLDVFKKYVKPLLESKCLRCHGGKKVESDFDLSDREGLLKGGQIGNSVVPGKSKESQLIKLISHAKEPNMPSGGDKLPDAAIARIIEWIDLGAPYDNPLVASKLKGKSWTERTLPASAKKWWSYEPLGTAEPPAVSLPSSSLATKDWCRTSIDRFILAKLEEAKIAPNAPATKHQLIRRAFFDLIGLPPTPQEVQAFVNDTSPDAFAKVVDKLLASPHYGERWGRHWLDLARFAESHGFEHDTDRPTAYHYRDFVIEALNRDLPYDTFVKWQIAGDEYEPNNHLAVKATGFLAAGVHSTQITKNEVEKHRYDELDDKLNTISTAFLGLSVGCARCHDHKYDPIPQRDYYRMLATFTTTVRSEMDLTIDMPAYVKAKAAFEREHAPFVAAMTNREQALRPTLDALVKPNDNAAWEYVEVKGTKSKDGSTLTLQEDGSILATGKNPKFDVYTIVTHTTMTRINAVRLEALSHPSMAKGGPGRAGNGNFALSDFSVAVAPLNLKVGGAVLPDPSGFLATKVALKNPRATFEQKGLPIKATIDADPKSAWAVDPQFGKDHAATFDLNTPTGFDGGTILTFTLKFNNNVGHNIGRLRLSISNQAKTPELAAPGLPASVRDVIGIPATKRTNEQTSTLLAWARTLDAEWRTLNEKRLQHHAKAPQPTRIKTLAATEGLPALRLHTQGEDFFPETYYLRRGDPANKEGVATQSFLQVLMRTPDAEKHWQTAPPAGWRTSYRRRAFAEWITDVDHGAGHLLARVIVNRLWQHHMGRGLVTTPSDFGVRGEPPTHPELLDHLAGELIKSGWRLKTMHKLIMTSAAYQESTQVHQAKVKVDRDNKLYWRQPSRRLEAEIIRDAMLAVGGDLDAKLFGPGTLDDKSKRRSIYFTIKRSKLVPMMVIFDAPEALSGMAERPTTTIAPQALHMLNNPQVRQTARSFARRISPASTTPLEDAVRAGYQIALARQPTRDELADGIAFIRQQMPTYPENQRRESALADFCQVLMCLNEFIYVD